MWVVVFYEVLKFLIVKFCRGDLYRILVISVRIGNLERVEKYREKWIFIYSFYSDVNVVKIREIKFV